ncbi:hypothetical protein E4T47_01038 [Aureobasidium subglaciale]|nr:hypothetical protein E4T47_01038 [Aureobasidium subglaciale]
MELPLPLLSLLPLALFCAASPTPASYQIHTAQTATISPTQATPFPRHNDKYVPSVPPLSLDLPTISIAKSSIPSLSLDLPPEICTPGFSSYATPSLVGYAPAVKPSYIARPSAGSSSWLLFGRLVLMLFVLSGPKISSPWALRLSPRSWS